VVGKLQIEIRPIVFVLSLLFFSGGCSSTRDATDFFYNTDSIQSGDIILRKGYGLVSEIIVFQLNDSVEVSHCGIISLNEKGEFDVIHSLSQKVSEHNGMQICSLAEFMDDSKIESVRVLRYNNDNSSLIEHYAKFYLKQGIYFDENFDMSDTTSFYCMELPIFIIHKTFNNDISNGAEKPLFSIFFDKKNFTEIPFLKRKSHLQK
jgi:hypothetical protein